MDISSARRFDAVGTNILTAVLLLSLFVFPVLQPPEPVKAQAPDVDWTEDVSKRTESSRTYSVNGSERVRVKEGAVHYWNGDNWTLIDNSLVPAVAPYDYEMKKDAYSVSIKADFTAGQIIQYGAGGQTVDFQPMPLKWTNDLEQVEQISIPQDVTPVLNNQGYEILTGVPTYEGLVTWEDAFGSGIDFTYKVSPSRLNKLVTVGGLSDLPTPSQFIIDGGNPDLAVEFLFDPSNGLTAFVDGAEWNERDTITTPDAVEFRTADNVTRFAFTAPRYWDVTEEDITATTTLEKRGNSLFVSVRVPYDWLTSATYPVKIDPSVTVATSAQLEDVHYREVLNQWFVNAECRAGGDASFEELGCGMRFSGLSVPLNSTPTDAYIVFRAERNMSGTPTNTRFSGENVTNPSAFIDDYPTYWNRYLNRYTAEVDWDALPAWTAGNDYTSPNLTSIFQSALDLASGTTTSLLFFWQDYDDRTSPPGGCANCVRVAESWDTDSANAPELTLEYILPPITPPANFDVTDLGGITYSFNWTAGVGANVTGYSIYVDRDDYPDTTGEHIYNGNASAVLSVNITGWSANQTYYFTIYSYGDDAYSTNGTTATIGTNLVIPEVDLSEYLKGEDMEVVSESIDGIAVYFGHFIILAIVVYFQIVALKERQTADWYIAGFASLLYAFINLTFLEWGVTLFFLASFLNFYKGTQTYKGSRRK